jgi:hypothetical protein
MLELALGPLERLARVLRSAEEAAAIRSPPDPIDLLPGLRADGSGEPYCGDSTGSLDRSQFDPELLQHNIAAREQESDLPLHPNRCGPCPDCEEFIYWHEKKLWDEYYWRELAAAEQKGLRDFDASAPTLEQLRRHTARFGLECLPKAEKTKNTCSGSCLLEAAAAYLGVDELTLLEAELVRSTSSNGKPVRTRQRRTTGELREQVLALHNRGLRPTVIADALNIGDRRVQAILATSRMSENGGGKRLNHARKNAAKGVGRPAAHPGRQAASEQLALLGEEEDR